MIPRPVVFGLSLAVWCGLSSGAAAADGPVAAPSGVPSILWVYAVCVIASSCLGGYLPSLIRLTHTRLQVLISLIGGLMLGVGLLHQLPHAVSAMSDAGRPHALDHSLLWMLGGLTAMFFLLRMFHFHQHDHFEDGPPASGHTHRHGHDHDHDHRHDHDHDHSHDHDHDAGAAGRRQVHGASWIGIALGLSLHTLIDGLALAAHVEADRLHLPSAWWPGVGTFLGIVLHKPLDSLSITSLMSAGGWSARSRLLVNLGYACLCPLGAVLFYQGLSSFGGGGAIVGAALAFSAGVFVCIALSDLLPEVEFHSHDRIPLSLSLLVGLVLSWAIGFLEPEHSHGGGSGPKATNAADTHDHDHDHDH